MILISIAIVDTGALLAAVDAREPNHERCAAVLERPDLQLVVPTMVVAEATYMIQRQLGAAAELAFLRGITQLEVEPPVGGDWPRIAELVEHYADLGLGGTDASVVALSERLGATKVVTLDRRHFSVVRSRHVKSFELLPA